MTKDEWKLKLAELVKQSAADLTAALVTLPAPRNADRGGAYEAVGKLQMLHEELLVLLRKFSE